MHHYFCRILYMFVLTENINKMICICQSDNMQSATLLCILVLTTRILYGQYHSGNDQYTPYTIITHFTKYEKLSKSLANTDRSTGTCID